MESWGCPWQPFLTMKSDAKFPCKFPGVPDKSFTSGYLKEGTVCSNMKPSMKRIDQAPYWSTNINDGVGVTMKCVCDSGCNICEWKADDVERELGVPQVLPESSHFNGIGRDYVFKGGIKHM